MLLAKTGRINLSLKQGRIEEKEVLVWCRRVVMSVVGGGWGVAREFVVIFKKSQTLDLINTAYLSALGDDYSRKIIQ